MLHSLLAPEPSVEEKLQKLHSEIKFALKVDNPVRPSQGTEATLQPLPPSQAVPLSLVSGAPLEASGN